MSSSQDLPNVSQDSDAPSNTQQQGPIETGNTIPGEHDTSQSNLNDKDQGDDNQVEHTKATGDNTLENENWKYN